MSSEALHRDPPKQERSDLQPRPVLLAIAAIVAMVLIVALVAAGLLRGIRLPSAPSTAAPPSPAVRLSSNPEAEITAFQRQKRSQLESYGWVDRDRGIAHVPIERAMEVLAGQKSAPER